jgi:hypothetical protein
MGKKNGFFFPHADCGVEMSVCSGRNDSELVPHTDNCNLFPPIAKVLCPLVCDVNALKPRSRL